MSNTSNQRAAHTNTDARDAQDPDGGDNALNDVRAETDRLFAVAAKSFAAMSEGNSEAFLRRSRQSGGQ